MGVNLLTMHQQGQKPGPERNAQQSVALKLSGFESADYICVQWGNGVVTPVVEAGRRAEPDGTHLLSDRQKEKEKGLHHRK